MKKRQNGISRQRHSERGQSLLLMAGLLVVLLGMAAFVVDLGNAYFSSRQLQAATDAAALAGAEDLPNSTAVSTATKYSAVSGNLNAHSTLTNVSMVTGYPQLKCLTSVGVPCLPPANMNAITVRQQATVPTFFARILGVKSLTIGATATATARGGSAAPFNVMLVLDTTDSMNTADTSCDIKGASRLDCAMAGVRTLMSTLSPCASSLTSCGSVTKGNVNQPVDEVGLFVFPGLTNTSQVQYEYDCSNTPAPKIASYAASPIYSIVPLSSDFRTSDSITALNTSSNLVIASRGGNTSCSEGLDAVGGVGTYYADAITNAQTALVAAARPSTTNVIIVLSDGDAGAAKNEMPAGMVNQQCHEAITAAQTAARAGTWVYTIAYGAPLSGCSSDTNPTISPCAALQQMASDSTKFFSDQTGSNNACTSAAHPITGLNQIFQTIGGDLTLARLIPDATK